MDLGIHCFSRRLLRCVSYKHQSVHHRFVAIRMGDGLIKIRRIEDDLEGRKLYSPVHHRITLPNQVELISTANLYLFCCC